MNIFAALFTSNFWMSGLAIARYVPHSFRVRRVDGNVFFTEVKRTEFRSRIERLTENAPRQWGTMNVAQMLHHLNLACGGSLGFYNLPDESYLVSRTIFKWILVDWFSEQPVGLRLPAGFKITHEDQFSFESEQLRLLAILDSAFQARSVRDWQPHCMFGKMTPKEWGKLLLIHADYHLNNSRPDSDVDRRQRREPMTNLLILGASGLVGRNALEQAIADPNVTAVIAPTRLPLANYVKLTNPSLLVWRFIPWWPPGLSLAFYVRLERRW